MPTNSVLLDTSFLIRLMNRQDKWHPIAREYFRELLNEGWILKVSTIAIAEYCVKDAADHLPLKNLQILPFNFKHAERAGQFGNILFEARKEGSDSQENCRCTVTNDAKLFAQAHVEPHIRHFLTSDSRARKHYDVLCKTERINFSFVDIQKKPVNEFFGRLGF